MQENKTSSPIPEQPAPVPAKKKRPLPFVRNLRFWLIAAGLVLLLALGIWLGVKASTKPEPESKAEILTVSALKEIIDVSELSTFTAVYNGVAIVTNEKDPEEIDYYVSYEATVDAGIDFAAVDIQLLPNTHTVVVTLPDVQITNTNVQVESLDFLFYNEKANHSTVLEQALKACETDLALESEGHTAISDLAKDNAINVLTALLQPIIEQLGADYALVID